MRSSHFQAKLFAKSQQPLQNTNVTICTNHIVHIQELCPLNGKWTFVVGHEQEHKKAPLSFHGVGWGKPHQSHCICGPKNWWIYICILQRDILFMVFFWFLFCALVYIRQSHLGPVQPGRHWPVPVRWSQAAAFLQSHTWWPSSPPKTSGQAEDGKWRECDFDLCIQPSGKQHPPPPIELLGN